MNGKRRSRARHPMGPAALETSTDRRSQRCGATQCAAVHVATRSAPGSGVATRSMCNASVEQLASGADHQHGRGPFGSGVVAAVIWHAGIGVRVVPLVSSTVRRRVCPMVPTRPTPIRTTQDSSQRSRRSTWRPPGGAGKHDIYHATRRARPASGELAIARIHRHRDLATARDIDRLWCAAAPDADLVGSTRDHGS